MNLCKFLLNSFSGERIQKTIFLNLKIIFIYFLIWHKIIVKLLDQSILFLCFCRLITLQKVVSLWLWFQNHVFSTVIIRLKKI